MPTVTAAAAAAEATAQSFALEHYFAGQSRAWGVFVDRFGRLRSRFTVDITGTWDGEVLTLKEDFHYLDGKSEHRTWRIRRTESGGYAAEADSVIGSAEGDQLDGAVNLRYRFLLKVGGSTLKVRFDDWFYRHDDDVVVNRASISKFGIKLGDVIAFYQPVTPPEPSGAS